MKMFESSKLELTVRLNKKIPKKDLIRAYGAKDVTEVYNSFMKLIGKYITDKNIRTKIAHHPDAVDLRPDITHRHEVYTSFPRGLGAPLPSNFPSIDDSIIGLITYYHPNSRNDKAWYFDLQIPNSEELPFGTTSFKQQFGQSNLIYLSLQLSPRFPNRQEFRDYSFKELERKKEKNERLRSVL